MPSISWLQSLKLNPSEEGHLTHHIYNRLRAGCYHTPIPAHRVIVNELLTPALSSAGLGSCGSGIRMSKNINQGSLSGYARVTFLKVGS